MNFVSYVSPSNFRFEECLVISLSAKLLFNNPVKLPVPLVSIPKPVRLT